MPEQEIAFALVLVTLREEQTALADALEVLKAHEPEMATLHHLLEAARELADQAQALVLLMKESRADKASLADA